MQCIRSSYLFLTGLSAAPSRSFQFQVPPRKLKNMSPPPTSVGQRMFNIPSARALTCNQIFVFPNLSFLHLSSEMESVNL